MTSASPVHPALAALRLERSPDDTTRAILLAAIEDYARAVGDEPLRQAARAWMPLADPFRPSVAWMTQYADGFHSTADRDCGVDPDESDRYGTEFWQAFSDEARQKRVEHPRLGFTDGQRDARNLNEA